MEGQRKAFRCEHGGVSIEYVLLIFGVAMAIVLALVAFGKNMNLAIWKEDKRIAGGVFDIGLTVASVDPYELKIGLIWNPDSQDLQFVLQRRVSDEEWIDVWTGSDDEGRYEDTVSSPGIYEYRIKLPDDDIATPPVVVEVPDLQLKLVGQGVLTEAPESILSWNYVGATDYSVYRRSILWGPYTKIATIKVSSFETTITWTDSATSNPSNPPVLGDVYLYKVVAEGKGKQSNIVSIRFNKKQDGSLARLDMLSKPFTSYSGVGLYPLWIHLSDEWASVLCYPAKNTSLYTPIAQPILTSAQRRSTYVRFYIVHRESGKIYDLTPSGGMALSDGLSSYVSGDYAIANQQLTTSYIYQYDRASDKWVSLGTVDAGKLPILLKEGYLAVPPWYIDYTLRGPYNKQTYRLYELKNSLSNQVGIEYWCYSYGEPYWSNTAYSFLARYAWSNEGRGKIMTRWNQENSVLAVPLTATSEYLNGAAIAQIDSSDPRHRLIKFHEYAPGTNAKYSTLSYSNNKVPVDTNAGQLLLDDGSMMQKFAMSRDGRYRAYYIGRAYTNASFKTPYAGPAGPLAPILHDSLDGKTYMIAKSYPRPFSGLLAGMMSYDAGYYTDLIGVALGRVFMTLRNGDLVWIDIDLIKSSQWQNNLPSYYGPIDDLYQLIASSSKNGVISDGFDPMSVYGSGSFAPQVYEAPNGEYCVILKTDTAEPYKSDAYILER